MAEGDDNNGEGTGAGRGNGAEAPPALVELGRKPEARTARAQLPSRRRDPALFLQPRELEQSNRPDRTADLLITAEDLLDDPASRGIILAQHCSHASHGSHGSHGQW